MSHLHHKVSALIDGELSPSARARAIAHARSCEGCRREIAETLEVKRRVNSLSPVDVSFDLLEVVSSLAPAPLRSTGRDRPALLRKVFFSVGSLSAAVIALAYVVGAPEVTQATPVNPPVEEFALEFADSTGLAPLSDPAVDGLGGTMAQNSGYLTQIGLGAQQKSGQPGTRLPGNAISTTDDPAALSLLRRAVRAPRHIAFNGLRVVRSFTSQGVDQYGVEIYHVPGQGTMFDVRDGNGESGARSFIPESEQVDELTATPIDALAAAYDVAVEGPQRIDGRATTVISASQDGQIVARFWVDVTSGLLLQRAMYVDGSLVRWSGYTSITTSRHAFMSHLPPEVPALPTTDLPRTLVDALNDKGWTCPTELTSEFHLTFLRQVDTAGGVMHAEYTDGLSTVSVFEERGSLNPDSLAGFRVVTSGESPLYVRDGLPMMAVWQADDTVFTLVTDAPEQLASALISRFPHAVDKPQSGVTSRIGTGLSRLVSTVAP